MNSHEHHVYLMSKGTGSLAMQVILRLHKLKSTTPLKDGVAILCFQLITGKIISIINVAVVVIDVPGRLLFVYLYVTCVLPNEVILLVFRLIFFLFSILSTEDK